MRPLGIEPGPIRSPTCCHWCIWPWHVTRPKTHANEACIFKCDANKSKKKRKRRNLNSAPSARVNTRHHCCTSKNQQTGAYLSLMAAGLQRGAHNHCLNNLLPEKRIQKKPQIVFSNADKTSTTKVKSVTKKLYVNVIHSRTFWNHC